MKITMHDTRRRFVEHDGVTLSEWHGETEGGAAVTVFVHHVAEDELGPAELDERAPNDDTTEKDRRIRELEGQLAGILKASAAVFQAIEERAPEVAAGDEPSDVTIVRLREMVAEARGRKSAEATLTIARHDLQRVTEAKNPVDRGAAALCLAARALVIYEMQRRQAKGN